MNVSTNMISTEFDIFVVYSLETVLSIAYELSISCSAGLTGVALVGSNSLPLTLHC